MSNVNLKDQIISIQSLKGLKIAHLNCTSLTKHLDEIKCMLKECNFAILTLSETHLSEYISNGEIQITGYDIIRRDRNRSGGGVAAYIKHGITYTQIDDIVPNNYLEIITLEVKFGRYKSFYVIDWYRPPNAKRLNVLICLQISCKL